mgnify:FL=1|tara:strand:- start:40 stop:603 length:564 start_codon:yes stop_codon:yes gene_type:complete
MNVLVGCEFTGTVRDEFRKKGHNAYSCDIIPSEKDNKFHIQTDIRSLNFKRFDLGIFFPPCTHLCVSGARWFKGKQKEQKESLEFVKFLMDLPIPKIAIENPIGVISTRIRKPDQIIQPYQFGHEETKSTCLWLKNLPRLVPTQVMKTRNKNLTPSGQNKIGPSKDRWKIRSRTYLGIAKAMADQWV